MAGLFITFEGPEAAGKTTQIRLLEETLRERGHSVLCTREPGGTPLAEGIRNILLTRGDEAVSMETELLLFAASRAQHVAQLIRPHLEKGGIVICDRFIDSTAAYQGYARGVSLKLIDTLNRFAVGRTFPDLTFLLDLPMEETRRRLAKRDGCDGADRLEAEDNAFHQRVREGFLEIAFRNRDRFRLIDATAPVGEISAYIRKEVCDAVEGL